MIDVLRVRRLWLVSAAVVGVAVGLIVAFVGSASRRAEATVLVSSKSGPSQVVPFLPDLKTLATSSLLAGNIRSTLRLSESEESVRRRLRASIRPQTQVIAISATGSDARSTQQLAQEAAVVFALLVGERFRTTAPPLRASVLDPAHLLGGPERHVLRNALIGAVLGLAIGTAVAVLLGGVSAVPAQAPPREARDLSRREALLERRVKTVTARERELASSAASLATRDRELAKREREVEERAAAAAEVVMAPEPTRAPEPEPIVAAQHEPEPEPELKPEVVAAPPPEPATASTGGWNINELGRLVAARAADTPTATLEEWRSYLFYLRDVANTDGDLPSPFSPLVEDIFGDLLA